MLNIRLLGSQAVLDVDSGHIATRSTRTIALLGLLVARSGVPQDRMLIAGLFWPDSTDSQALTNLRRELHQLRRLLGEADHSLEATSTQLCWHDRGHHIIDLSTFLRECAEAEGDDQSVLDHGPPALTAYAGALIPGLDEPWLEELRRELNHQCAALCDRVVVAARAIGRTEVAITALHKRILIDAYDEEAHRRLMELYVEAGDRARAISTYHRLATRLEHDLGVPPDRQTIDVLTRVLGDVTRDSGSDVSNRLADPELVAREAELSVLLGAWHAAVAGQASVIVVQGGPGVGKSRLVRELVRQVRREGGLVGLSTCFDTSGRLSLAPVAEWLREPAVAAFRERLSEIWQVEADRLVPAGGEASATSVHTDERPKDVWQRHRFFEGLARALLASRRPMLLVLDNTQWCDPDTLSFVRFLLNIAPRAPLLVAVTIRTIEGDSAGASEWLGRLRDEGLLTELPLAPLTREGTLALAASLRGGVPGALAADLIYGATGGFPLFVVEAARSSLDLSASTSRPMVGWRGILEKRIQQASPAGREVAGVAAAVGRDFTIPLLAEACDLEPETVARAVDELWRRRIIREIGGRYDFSHDLLRQAAYNEVTPARRWLLHRRLAQALELLWPGHTDAVAAQVAQQYQLAGNHERAMRYYRRAADVAAAMFAHEEQLALLGSARELLLSTPAGRDRDEQELRLLEDSIPPLNARYGYSSPQLRDVCERSVELAEELGDRRRMLTATVALWASRFVEGRLAESFDAAQRALSLVGPGDARIGHAHFSLAGSALHLGHTTTALEHFATAYATMGDETLAFGTRARVHTTGWWAHAHWTAGDGELADELASAATHEARLSGHKYSLVAALAFEAVTRQLLEQHDHCASAAVEARALSARYQFTYYDEWARILEGWAIGDDDGVQLIETGLANLRRQGARVRRPYWLGLLARTTADPTQANRALTTALTTAAESGEGWWVPELLRLQAATLPTEERLGRLREALALAAAQGSAGLAARCQADIGAVST